jgi:DNA-binding NarL/FixJ family response regulator
MSASSRPGRCRALRAEPLGNRVRNLAQRARIVLRDDDNVEADPRVAAGAELGLTPREVEVLGHVTAGRSDREIGATLFISTKTVSVHVSNVLRKLGVANRIEAGRIGQTHGLVH